MQNLTYKILEKHLLKGKLEAGQPIEIKMDQTLTQDATGTMAYMQFEAMGVKKQNYLSAMWITIHYRMDL